VLAAYGQGLICDCWEWVGQVGSGWGRMGLAVVIAGMWWLSSGGGDCPLMTIASKASSVADKVAIATSRQLAALNMGSKQCRSSVWVVGVS